MKKFPSKVKRVPDKYDWMEGFRYSRIIWYDNKGKTVGRYIDILFVCLLHNMTPEQYVADLGDKGLITGELEKDLLYYLQTPNSKGFSELYEAQVKNKIKVEG